MQKITDFGEWLLNYIPPKLTVVDKVLDFFKNKIKKIYEKKRVQIETKRKESKSALKTIAIQYQIKD